MSLLIPTNGRLLIDGIDVNDPDHPERQAAWRASISHVPQNIYLADSTIAENIGFGLPPHKISMTRVKRVAEQAQISEFIETCQDGYQTLVGEYGVKLSGGQRQRIGIARALYQEANVLILDEATSALDNTTEGLVMNEIEWLSKENLTVIMIAHRLSTLKDCDRVISIENGFIVSDLPHPPN